MLKTLKRISGGNWRTQVKQAVGMACMAACLCGPVAANAGDTATVDSFRVASTYTGRVTTDAFGRTVASARIGWRLYVPKGYDSNAATRYPLVFTLHGVGEGGTDNRAQLKYRFNRMWADDTMQAKQKMFVLAPQNVNSSTTWTQVPGTAGPLNYATQTINPGLAAALQLLDSLLTAYKIDTTRLYVSGESSGGFATWYLLARFPRRWAAALPVCACGDTSGAIQNQYLNTPIWIFHGSADPTVNVNCSRQMFASLNRHYIAAGKDTANTLRYSEYAGVQHNSWENASRDPRVMPWTVSKINAYATAIRARAGKLFSDGRRLIVRATDVLGRNHPAGDLKRGVFKPFKIKD